MPGSIWTAAPAAVLVALGAVALAFAWDAPFGMYFAFLALALAIMVNAAVSLAALLLVLRGRPGRDFWQTFALSGAVIVYLAIAAYLKPRGMA